MEAENRGEGEGHSAARRWECWAHHHWHSEDVSWNTADTADIVFHMVQVLSASCGISQQLKQPHGPAVWHFK